LALALSLLPSLAHGDEPSAADRARSRVESGLVKPLAAKEQERSRFSRGRPPPRESRVRVEQSAESADAKGRRFLAFAIDVRYGQSEWRQDDVVGCVYSATGEVYVKKGDEYRPASFLLGKKAAAVPGVCREGEREREATTARS
jgi:hypothetical protein